MNKKIKITFKSLLILIIFFLIFFLRIVNHFPIFLDKRYWNFLLILLESSNISPLTPLPNLLNVIGFTITYSEDELENLNSSQDIHFSFFEIIYKIVELLFSKFRYYSFFRTII